MAEEESVGDLVVHLRGDAEDLVVLTSATAKTYNTITATADAAQIRLAAGWKNTTKAQVQSLNEIKSKVEDTSRYTQQYADNMEKIRGKVAGHIKDIYQEQKSSYYNDREHAGPGGRKGGGPGEEILRHSFLIGRIVGNLGSAFGASGATEPVRLFLHTAEALGPAIGAGVAAAVLLGAVVYEAQEHAEELAKAQSDYNKELETSINRANALVQAQEPITAPGAQFASRETEARDEADALRRKREMDDYLLHNTISGLGERILYGKGANGGFTPGDIDENTALGQQRALEDRQRQRAQKEAENFRRQAEQQRIIQNSRLQEDRETQTKASDIAAMIDTPQKRREQLDLNYENNRTKIKREAEDKRANIESAYHDAEVKRAEDLQEQLKAINPEGHQLEGEDAKKALAAKAQYAKDEANAARDHANSLKSVDANEGADSAAAAIQHSNDLKEEQNRLDEIRIQNTNKLESAQIRSSFHGYERQRQELLASGRQALAEAERHNPQEAQRQKDINFANEQADAKDHAHQIETVMRGLQTQERKALHPDQGIAADWDALSFHLIYDLGIVGKALEEFHKQFIKTMSASTHRELADSAASQRRAIDSMLAPSDTVANQWADRLQELKKMPGITQKEIDEQHKLFIETDALKKKHQEVNDLAQIHLQTQIALHPERRLQLEWAEKERQLRLDDRSKDIPAQKKAFFEQAAAEAIREQADAMASMKSQTSTILHPEQGINNQVLEFDRKLREEGKLNEKQIQEQDAAYRQLLQAQANAGLIENIKEQNINLRESLHLISEEEAAYERLKLANLTADDALVKQKAHLQEIGRLSQWALQQMAQFHPQVQLAQYNRELQEAVKLGILTQAQAQDFLRREAAQVGLGQLNAGQATTEYAAGQVNVHALNLNKPIDPTQAVLQGNLLLQGIEANTAKLVTQNGGGVN